MIDGRIFTRRHFVQVAGTALLASYFEPVLEASLLETRTTAGAKVRGTAKNCIFIFLWGAPSNVDTFDLKEGPWLPKSFAPTSYGDVRFPQGLMPRMAEHLGRLAFVRSGLAWAAVHPIARRWTQIARNPASTSAVVAPHIGSVVSAELQSQRKETDVLPAFVSLSYYGGRNSAAHLVDAGSGFLSAEHAPLFVTPAVDGMPLLHHPAGRERFDRRWAMMRAVGAARGTDDDASRSALASAYVQAKRMFDANDLDATFRFTADERARYGGTAFAEGMIVARNLIASRRGTRFVQISTGNWDHHQAIYTKSGLLGSCGELDPAVGALMSDLLATPGSEPGKTLLDETLIVMFGEFGRTVGPPNAAGGRDHFQRMSLAFAGGGIRGGQAVGVTDAVGSGVTAFGWSADRDVRPEDVAATIYSALGIDYTTMRTDVPSVRRFEYVPGAKDGVYTSVDELFG